MHFLPPSSFTFKMAFGNGTALMLKPEGRQMEIHHCNDIKELCLCICVLGKNQLVGMLAGLLYNSEKKNQFIM